MKTELLSFLYLYGVGGFLFTGSLILTIRRKALDPRSREGKRILRVLLFGYLAYALFHALTQFVLPRWGGPS